MVIVARWLQSTDVVGANHAEGDARRRSAACELRSARRADARDPGPFPEPPRSRGGLGFGHGKRTTNTLSGSRGPSSEEEDVRNVMSL